MGIYVVNRDSSGLKKIADGNAAYPTWSPDGNELIYNKTADNSVELFKVTLDSGVSEQLTHRSANFHADWFDPAFALPVSPESSLLTTIWGKLKTQD